MQAPHEQTRDQARTGKARGEAGPTRGRLRCLTYNIGCHYFSPNDEKHMWARLKGLVPHIARANIDVLILQELYTLSLPWPLGWGQELRWFSARMRELGFVVRAPAPGLLTDNSTPWMGMNSGLVIFSKLPLAPTENGREPIAMHVFKNNGFFQHKGFLRASFRVCWAEDGEGAPVSSASSPQSSSSLVHVICVHLDHANHRKRLAQKRVIEVEVSNLLRDDPEEAATIIVAGDFNHTCSTLDSCPNFVGMAPQGQVTHKHNLALDNALVRFGRAGEGRMGSGRVLSWRYLNQGVSMRLSDHDAVAFEIGPQVGPG